MKIFIEIFFSVMENRRAKRYNVKLAKEECRLNIVKFSFSEKERIGTNYQLIVWAQEVFKFKNKIDIQFIFG